MTIDVVYGFCVDIRSHTFLKNFMGVLFVNKYFNPNRTLKIEDDPVLNVEFNTEIRDIIARINDLITPLEGIVMYIHKNHVIVGTSLAINRINDTDVVEMRGTEARDYEKIDEFVEENSFFQLFNEGIYCVNLSSPELNASFSAEFSCDFTLSQSLSRSFSQNTFYDL